MIRGNATSVAAQASCSGTLTATYLLLQESKHLQLLGLIKRLSIVRLHGMQQVFCRCSLLGHQPVTVAGEQTRAATTHRMVSQMASLL